MQFQPTPAQLEWLGGVFVVLTAATAGLHFAEKVWSFINKIINDCQRRKRIQAKRKAQLAARREKKVAKFPARKQVKAVPSNPNDSEPEKPENPSHKKAA